MFMGNKELPIYESGIEEFAEFLRDENESLGTEVVVEPLGDGAPVPYYTFEQYLDGLAIPRDKYVGAIYTTRKKRLRNLRVEGTLDVEGYTTPVYEIMEPLPENIYTVPPEEGFVPLKDGNNILVCKAPKKKWTIIRLIDVGSVIAASVITIGMLLGKITI